MTTYKAIIRLTTPENRYRKQVVTLGHVYNKVDENSNFINLARSFAQAGHEFRLALTNSQVRTESIDIIAVETRELT